MSCDALFLNKIFKCLTHFIFENKLLFLNGKPYDHINMSKNSFREALYVFMFSGISNVEVRKIYGNHI